MTTPSNVAPHVPFGWCHWHKGPSGTAALVRIIEQGSDPGAGLYACAPCRDQRKLVPLADQADETAWKAYMLHTTKCELCNQVTQANRLTRCEIGAQLCAAYQEQLAPAS